jgi:adenylate cyclase
MTTPNAQLHALADIGAALGEVSGLETVIDTALEALDTRVGFSHVLLMVHHRDTDRLTTIASRGYDASGIGSEVRVGEGVIGTAAATRRPMRIGNLQRMLAYVRTVQKGTADDDGTEARIRLPGLAAARSQIAAPMIADGVLIGVIAAESEQAVAFDDSDELVLAVAAQLVAGALERAEIVARIEPPEPESVALVPGDVPVGPAETASTLRRPPSRLRHYPSDGSTFIDDEYVIKGVAGRLLWKLASEHVTTGRASYTNREVRLDPALDMPSFRDNFESRLVLLKRRLEERDCPLRIRRTGRGRFEVESLAALSLERMEGSATSTT